MSWANGVGRIGSVLGSMLGGFLAIFVMGLVRARAPRRLQTQA